MIIYNHIESQCIFWNFRLFQLLSKELLRFPSCTNSPHGASIDSGSFQLLQVPMIKNPLTRRTEFQLAFKFDTKLSSWWFQPLWKNISTKWESSQIGVKIKNIWNHHQVIDIIAQGAIVNEGAEGKIKKRTFSWVKFTLRIFFQHSLETFGINKEQQWVWPPR